MVYNHWRFCIAFFFHRYLWKYVCGFFLINSHNITEILLKVALNTTTLTLNLFLFNICSQKIIRFLNTGKFLKIDIFFGILLGKIITLLLSKVRGRKYKCFSLGSIIPLINYKCFLLPLINYKHPILTPLPLFVGQWQATGF